MTKFYIETLHPPLATQVEFQRTSLTPPPTLACLIEFTPERLADIDEAQSTSANRQSSSRAGEHREPEVTRRQPQQSEESNAQASGSRNEFVQQDAPSVVTVEADQVPRSPKKATPRSKSSKLIPKPQGEPGRPSCGGYSLEEVLVVMHHWSKEDFDNFNVRPFIVRIVLRANTWRAGRCPNRGATQAGCNTQFQESE